MSYWNFLRSNPVNELGGTDTIRPNPFAILSRRRICTNCTYVMFRRTSSYDILKMSNLTPNIYWPKFDKYSSVTRSPSWCNVALSCGTVLQQVGRKPVLIIVSLSCPFPMLMFNIHPNANYRKRFFIVWVWLLYMSILYNLVGKQQPTAACKASRSKQQLHRVDFAFGNIYSWEVDPSNKRTTNPKGHNICSWGTSKTKDIKKQIK